MLIELLPDFTGIGAGVQESDVGLVRDKFATLATGPVFVGPPMIRREGSLDAALGKQGSAR